MGQNFSYWDVEDLPELDRLQGFLANNEFIQKHYYPSDMKLWRRPLEIALNLVSSGRDLKKDLDRYFRLYIRELTNPTEKWQYIQTFTGAVAGRPFRLNKELLIQPLSAWYQRPHVARQRVTFPPLEGPSEKDKLALIATISSEKQPGGPHPSTGFFETTSGLLSAIRLLKPGNVQSHAFASGQVSEFPFEEPIAYSMASYSEDDEPEAQIRVGDERRIKDLWASLMPTGHWPSPFQAASPLREALNRLWRTYELQAWTDTIVDLTIAIEALLSPSDRQELSYRVSLRSAQLLGEKGEPSADIYRLVRLMYEIRSKTVHGAPIPPENRLAKWLEQLSGRKYKFEEGLGPLYSPATEAPRSVVKRLILGCLRLNARPKSEPTWPLPKDFDVIMLARAHQLEWQRRFQAKVWRFAVPS